VEQQYLPDDLLDAHYYEPSDNGLERDIAGRRKDNRKDLKSGDGNTPKESEI
jgi:replication-associated recombination protein RarA